MAVDYVFQVRFDPTLAFKYITIQRFTSTVLMIEGSYDADFGRWQILGPPDPHFPCRSGTFVFSNTSTASAAPDCVIRDGKNFRIARLKNFSYDVRSGALELDQQYLESVRRKYPFVDVAHAERGEWATLRHQYAHGSDGVVFTDDAGTNVLDRFDNIMFRPQKLDAKTILGEGIKSITSWESFDLIKSNFARGQKWDAQRLTGTFKPEFLDYATVLIGIFFCAARKSQADCLNTQNGYAADYPAYIIKDSTYTKLPARNVANTQIGFDLVNKGRITA